MCLRNADYLPFGEPLHCAYILKAFDSWRLSNYYNETKTQDMVKVSITPRQYRQPHRMFECSNDKNKTLYLFYECKTCIVFVGELIGKYFSWFIRPLRDKTCSFHDTVWKRFQLEI